MQINCRHVTFVNSNSLCHCSLACNYWGRLTLTNQLGSDSSSPFEYEKASFLVYSRKHYFYTLSQPALLDAISLQSLPLQGASFKLDPASLISTWKETLLVRLHLKTFLRPPADRSLAVASSTPTSTTSSSPLGFSFSHRRRRSSTTSLPQGLNVHASNDPKAPSRSVTTLAPIPGTSYFCW